MTLFNQNCHSQLHHNIPLFKISSDDTERKEYKTFKSGLNFLEGIANWIGIKNPKLTLEEDLFSEQADKDDYGLKKLIEEKFKITKKPILNIGFFIISQWRKLSVTASDFCNFSCEIFFFFLDTFTYF